MRIASLSPAITEILFALELGDQIVCTDQFSNFPEEVKEIPHLMDHQKIDVASLMEFELELIFTSTVIQEKLSEELKKHDVSVVHQDPRTISTIYDSIRSIGMMFQVDKEAEELILSLQQKLKEVKRKAGLLPKRMKLYIEEWHDPPMASGNWVPEIVHIAGGEPFPIPAGELSREVSLDEVLSFDPDMIIISWCGAGDMADKNLLLNREGWDQLRAVQEGSVRVIDDSLLNRPGPRVVEGAQRIYGWLFEALH